MCSTKKMASKISGGSQMRNNFKKFCVLVLCIGILSLAAPGAVDFQKKAPKMNLFKFFQKQAASVASWFMTIPVLEIIITAPFQEEVPGSQKQIKITGGLNVDRLGGGD